MYDRFDSKSNMYAPKVTRRESPFFFVSSSPLVLVPTSALLVVAVDDTAGTGGMDAPNAGKEEGGMDVALDGAAAADTTGLPVAGLALDDDEELDG